MAVKRVLAGLLLALVLLPAAALAATRASYSFVEFYVDKPQYLPGEPVTFTIVLKDKPNFQSQIYIYIDYYNMTLGQWQTKYFFIYPNDNGTAVVFHVATVGNNTVIKFTKSFEVTGKYRAKISISGSNIPASALTIEFTVAPQYQIAGYVVDENGAPVAGAKVCVVAAQTGEEVAMTTTSANGYFIVSVPGTGTYMVCAEAPRYLRNMTMVNVTSVGVTSIGKLYIESIDHAIATLRAQVKELSMMLEELAKNFTEFRSMAEEELMMLNESVTNLTSVVNNLSTRLANVEGAVQQLNTKVGNLEQRLGKLEETVNQLDQLTKQLANAVNDLSGRVDKLSARLDQALAQIDQRLSALEQEVQNIKQNYATKDELAQVQAQVNELRTKYGQLEKRLTNVESNVAALQKSLNDMSKRLVSLGNNLNNLQKQISDLVNRVDGASRTALIAVILAVIGIIIAIIATIAVYRRISA